eukprot:gene572-8082_t
MSKQLVLITGDSDANIVEIHEMFHKLSSDSGIRFEYIKLPNIQVLSEKNLSQFKNASALIFVVNSTSISMNQSVSLFHQIINSSSNWKVIISPNATTKNYRRTPSKEIGTIFKLDKCNHLIKDGLVQSIHLENKINDIKIAMEWLKKSLKKKSVRFNEREEINLISPLVDRIDEEFPFFSHLPDSEKPKKVREYNKNIKMIYSDSDDDEPMTDFITLQNTKLNAKGIRVEAEKETNEFVSKKEFLMLQKTVSMLLKHVEEQDSKIKKQQMIISQLLENHKMIVHKLNNPQE